LNPSTGEIYVFGENAAQQAKLYVLDGAGQLSYELPVRDFPTASVLVY